MRFVQVVFERGQPPVWQIDVLLVRGLIHIDVCALLDGRWLPWESRWRRITCFLLAMLLAHPLVKLQNLSQ